MLMYFNAALNQTRKFCTDNGGTGAHVSNEVSRKRMWIVCPKLAALSHA